jgi:hypothetical protein
MSRSALWPMPATGGPFARALQNRTIRPRPRPDVAYQTDPIGWMVDELGIRENTLRWSKNRSYREHVWDGTQDPLVKIAEGLARGQNVGVESATGTGKTYLAAGLVLWFVACFEDALVVTVAPKEAQLTTQLWKELGPHMARFGARFPTAEKGELVLRMDAKAKDRDVWVALGWACGIEAGSESTTRAQGFHAAHMLVVTEETPGIPPATMNALGLTCVGSHNLRLALGNPNHRDDPLHKFCELPGTLHVRISALDHPNVVTGREIVPGATTLKALEAIRDEWGEGTPMCESRTRGISPAQAAEAMIQRCWCERAVMLYEVDAFRQMHNHAKALGVDVAQSENGDRAAIATFEGACLLDVKAFACRNATDLGTRVHQQMMDERIDPYYVGVDPIGVGAATVNELNRLTHYQVQSLNGGSLPYDSTQKAPDGSPSDWMPDANRFGNLRSQMWWQMRRDLETGRISLPDDPQLIRELTTPVSVIKNGKVYVEPKDQIKKRLGGKSPDKADAVVYANWVRRRWLAMPQESRELESCWAPDVLKAEYERTHRVGNLGPRSMSVNERLLDPMFGEMY